VAVLALVGTIAFAERQQEPIELAVRTADGAPISRARVQLAGLTYLTNDEGIVRLPRPKGDEDISVEHDDYVGMLGAVTSNTGSHQEVELLPVSVGGTTAPLPDLAAGAPQPGSTPPSVPTSAAATASAKSATAAATPSASPSPAVTPDALGGTITDANGAPIAKAWIATADTFVFTGTDGAFVFDPGVVTPGKELRVFASGYAEQQVKAPNDGKPLTVRLKPQPIKGIYYNPNISTTEADVDRLIDIANTTEVNAIVIDIKEELIFYDTQVQFFRDAGTVNPIIDLPGLLKKMHDNNIYTIARLVVFKDSLVAEHNPDLAVLDNVTGDLWRDQNGVAWVNPMVHDLWNVNLDLAYEAATLGFDEIQYDYVRFPTDGDMSRVDYGLENTQEVRERSISKFLQMSHERLIPTGVKLSADVFGYTVIVDDDLGIGQNFAMLADYVDYLSPMVYPSHWPEGSLALPGHPNSFPYETIEISMNAAKNKLGGNAMKVRPWLQDFSFPNLMPYGDKEVRAQIDAAEEAGTSGWLLWDPNNDYHVGALEPQKPQDAPTPAATPKAAIDRTRQAGYIRVRPA
jgi:hypothetical protein